MIIPKWGKTSKPYKLGHFPPELERAKVIEKMLLDGIRPLEIADNLGMTRNAIYLAINRYGLKK